MTEFSRYIRNLSYIGMALSGAFILYLSYFYALAPWAIPLSMLLGYFWGPFLLVIFLNIMSHIIDLLLRILRKRMRV